MPISAELAAVLGRKLLEKYLAGDGVPRPADDLIRPAEDIAKGIIQFVEEFGLDLGGITEGFEVNDEVVSNVIKGIKKIQTETRRLRADGVIGGRTLNWLLFRPRFGHHNRSIDNLPKSNTKSTPGGRLIRFFLEDDLPPIPGANALKLFNEAWASWSEVIDIEVHETDTADRGDANVIVKVGPFPGSVVAKADIGPPGSRQLNITFDTSQPWTALEFQATAAHEIGHLIGIKHAHVTAKNQLMNDFLDPAITTPQKFDVDAAVALGWKRL
jgi:hypothetical protein